MIPPISHIRLTLDQPPDVSKRAWRRVKKEAHFEQGMHWHQRMLPLHFRAGARRRYGYDPRSAAYERRKNRLHARGRIAGRGGADLVYSGESRRTLRQSRVVTSTPSKARITMLAPAYFKTRFLKQDVRDPETGEILRNKQTGQLLRARFTAQPDKISETVRTTGDERRELSTLLHREALDRLAKVRAKTTKVIR